jgi:transketolase
MADHLLKNDRVTICTVSDGASMEGEAKEAFAAIPGLAAKGLSILSSWSSPTTTPNSPAASPADSFSMQPTFAAMSVLGWNVIQVPDGNELSEVYLAVERGLEQARANPRAPVCLWVKTIKGFGVKATMESASGGHGFPLAGGEKIIEFVNEIYFGGEVPSELAAWSRDLRARLGEKGSRQKSRAAAAPPAAPGCQDGKDPGRPGQRRGPRRPGGLARVVPFRRSGRLDRHGVFPEELSGPVPGPGRCGGEHGEHRGGAVEGGADSDC